MVKWAQAVAACGWWTLAVIVPVAAHGAETPAEKKAAATRWSDLTPLATDIPFGNVRYPQLDVHGNVTFIADDPMYTASKGTNHGIYRFQADGKLVCLVRGGEATVPGTNATFKIIRGLQMDDDNGDDFIFNATDSTNKRGLYRWSKGQLETVARTGTTVLADEKDPIRSIEYGALYGTHLLYQATTAKRITVLVLHDLMAGTDRVLCRTGMDIPGHQDRRFRFIALQNWLDGDSIIFRAASSVDPNKPAAKGTIGLYGWFGIKDWTGASGELAPERLRTVVDGDTTVPISKVPGTVTFDFIGSAPIGGKTTAFEANGKDFAGIFVSKTPDGTVRCVVSNHTKFGGPFEGTFKEFAAYPTVIGQNVIFTASAEEGDADAPDDDDGADDANANKVAARYNGVFVYRLDRDELFALTDDRSQLGGKDISDFEIGGHFLVNDRFVVMVKFKDNTSQIFLGTIRPEAFKRLDGNPPAATPKPESAH